MSNRPTNKEIAVAVGMTENELGTYLVDSELLADGTWRFYFAAETPKHLRGRLKDFFIFDMPS
ncbi:hypothetical protein PSCICN_38310 [Pseudomonas cichorii]|uniref:hypothetical protein n=1 Tax=Pseudomonas cichorii TaxID=36746 RepID=UPI00191112A5|nr:hypothetical protein [Pseudomonas cichorii]GFM83139.1 hypothetical protein PSCICN_38310 [Pseudomonas cichorii]